jgi:hypothetical protein
MALESEERQFFVPETFRMFSRRGMTRSWYPMSLFTTSAWSACHRCTAANQRVTARYFREKTARPLSDLALSN